MTDALPASEEVSSPDVYIRIPQYIRKMYPEELGANGAVRALPPIKSKAAIATFGDSMFAVRLNETYTDTDALLMGERWYVTAAVRMARSILVVETADRDPLMILKGFDSVESPRVVIDQRIKWHALPGSDPNSTIHVPLPDDLRPSANGTFFFQALTGTLDPKHPAADVIPHRFKHYRAVQYSLDPNATNSKINVESDLSKHQMSGVYKPALAITTSKYLPRMMKLSLEPNGLIATVLGAIRGSASTLAEVAGIFVAGKNTIRVLLHHTVTEEDVSKYLFFAGVRAVESTFGVKQNLRPRTFSDTRGWNNKTPGTNTSSDRLIKISLRTGLAWSTAEVGPRLCAVLKLKFIKALGSEAVLGEAGSTEEAGHLHETAPGGLYRLSWIGAPQV